MTMKYSVECWVLSPDQHVLLLQVPARPGKHEAFWQPVTGGIEDGEGPREAVLREVFEETGLRLGAAEVREVAAGLEVVISPDLSVSKTLYLAKAPTTDIVTSPAEHQDHRWVPAHQVPGALHWDSNRETWALVRNHLSGTGADDGS